ncbi:peptidylprolyl isomerase [Capnocytophaga sp. G2]|jgi:Peptidyl-prolyl cis-trans isomerase (rotamase) - cyclophilin family|uniref:peptidylprolyl isomerase n=1 Tax=Capnocytophaga sp. G2 TaxID=3110695 RepID=UPI002B49CFDF|nr:peptidylprolyl isomerase [Capnocytophaga sp. G2]MEB3005303.1 peptidylprolyl isomerase [Capnocytophaga sp. G2]
MKKVKFWALLLPLLFVACKSAKYPNLKDGLYADIQTNKGDMLVELFYKATPGTVANFVSLAEGNNTYVENTYKGKHYYDGTTFHRVIKDFMIQGGDPTATGEGSPGYQFADEFVDTLKFTKKGQLAMANAGPATNGSQFFITEKDTPWLTNHHTIFGQVIKGEEVISLITSEKTNEADKPLSDVKINKIEIIRVGKEAEKFDAPKVFDTFMKEQIEIAKQKEAEEKAKSEKILSELAEQESQAIASPSGIKILKLKQGNGVQPKQGQTVLVNYAGYLRANGKLFDSNIKEVAQANGAYDQQRDMGGGYAPYPWEYSPKVGLIAGFKEALLGMQVGEKVRVFIPSALAYGKQEIKDLIPADSDLVFDIEIVDIAK